MAMITSLVEECPLNSGHYHSNESEECMTHDPASQPEQFSDLTLPPQKLAPLFNSTGRANHNHKNGEEQEPTTTASSSVGNCQFQYQQKEGNRKHMQQREEDSSCESSSPSSSTATTTDYCSSERDHQVLVVAGCNQCFMYFMLPKGAEKCPKCNNASLLHFH